MIKTNCFTFNAGKGHRPDLCNALTELKCAKGPCPFYKNFADVDPDYTKPITKNEMSKKARGPIIHKTTPPHHIPDGWL